MLAPYSAALYVADRVVQSGTFNMELVQTLHSKLLPLERMADEMLAAAKQRLYRGTRHRRAASLAGNLQRTGEGLHGRARIHVGSATRRLYGRRKGRTPAGRNRSTGLDSLSQGYQVSLSRTAEKYFARCDASTRDRLRQKNSKNCASIRSTRKTRSRSRARPANDRPGWAIYESFSALSN
jgi:hypothetical protein